MYSYCLLKRGVLSRGKVAELTMQIMRVRRAHRATRLHQHPNRLIADYGCDSNPVRVQLASCGIKLIIRFVPITALRSITIAAVCIAISRWLVERINAWLHGFHRLVVRYRHQWRFRQSWFICLMLSLSSRGFSEDLSPSGTFLTPHSPRNAGLRLTSSPSSSPIRNSAIDISVRPLGLKCVFNSY